MKVFLPLLIATLSVIPYADARDTKHLFSIQEALASDAFQDKLNPNIQLYFGDQPYTAPIKRVDKYVSNKKTNGVGKSDRKACDWVLLSALLALQERAVAEGGDSVVNIQSYYKKNVMSSASEYECHAGSIMSGVALRGEVVQLKP